MRTMILAALAVTLLLPAAPASALPPSGVTCGFVAVDRGTTEYEGVITGGPLVGDGTLTCTIQAGNDSHGNAVVAQASTTGSTVVVLTGSVSFPDWVDGGDVYYCTTFASSTGTYYWSSVTGGWSASPGGCPLASSVSASDPLLDPVRDMVSILCALLGCEVDASGLGVLYGLPDM